MILGENFLPPTSHHIELRVGNGGIPACEDLGFKLQHIDEFIVQEQEHQAVELGGSIVFHKVRGARFFFEKAIDRTGHRVSLSTGEQCLKSRHAECLFAAILHQATTEARLSGSIGTYHRELSHALQHSRLSSIDSFWQLYVHSLNLSPNLLKFRQNATSRPIFFRHPGQNEVTRRVKKEDTDIGVLLFIDIVCEYYSSATSVTLPVLRSTCT